MKSVVYKTALIFGASRGLGKSISLNLSEKVSTLILVSRKEKNLNEVKKSIKDRNPPVDVQNYTIDLSTPEGQSKSSELLEQFSPDLIIYCAGGGPHGRFEAKGWKDHFWALQVNQVSPMLLIHKWLQSPPSPNPRKFVIIGSSVAEKNQDPLATSYTAAKWGVRGFIEALQPELEGHRKSVWLFSPGHLDTDLIPANAPVRAKNLMAPETAAELLVQWLYEEGPWHLQLNEDEET